MRLCLLRAAVPTKALQRRTPLGARLFAVKVRPQVPNKAAAENARENKPRNVPGLRLMVILAGLAVASYLVRPEKLRPLPAAARDSLKRKVAIVFVIGDSGRVAADAAKKYNSVYVRYPKSGPNQAETVKETVAAVQALLAPHVAAGVTRFIFDGVPPEALPELEQQVVEPDLIADFRTEPGPTVDDENKFLQKYARSNRLSLIKTEQELDFVLEEKGLD